MFVLTLIAFIIIFLLFSIPIISISTLSQCTYNIELNRLTLYNGDHFFEFKYYIGFEYFNFLDIYLPTLYSSFTLDNSSTVISYNLFKSFENPSSDFIADLFYEIGPQSSMIDKFSKKPVLQSSSSTNENYHEFFESMVLAFDIISPIMAILGFNHLVLKGLGDWIQLMSMIMGIIALVTILTSVFTLGIIEGRTIPFWAGLAVGIISSLLLGVTIMQIAGICNGKFDKLVTILEVGNIIISISSIALVVIILMKKLNYLDSDESVDVGEEVGNSMIISCLSLLAAGICLGLGSKDLNRDMETFCRTAFFLFVICLFVGFLDVVGQGYN